MLISMHQFESITPRPPIHTRHTQSPSRYQGESMEYHRSTGANSLGMAMTTSGANWRKSMEFYWLNKKILDF